MKLEKTLLFKEEEVVYREKPMFWRFILGKNKNYRYLILSLFVSLFFFFLIKRSLKGETLDLKSLQVISFPILLASLTLIYPALIYRKAEYIFTTHRLIIKTGFIGVKYNIAFYPRLRKGKIEPFGTLNQSITIWTSRFPFTLTGLKDAEYIQEKVLEMRKDSYLRIEDNLTLKSDNSSSFQLDSDEKIVWASRPSKVIYSLFILLMVTVTIFIYLVSFHFLEFPKVISIFTSLTFCILLTPHNLNTSFAITNKRIITNELMKEKELKHQDVHFIILKINPIEKFLNRGSVYINENIVGGSRTHVEATKLHWIKEPEEVFTWLSKRPYV